MSVLCHIHQVLLLLGHINPPTNMWSFITFLISRYHRFSRLCEGDVARERESKGWGKRRLVRHFIHQHESNAPSLQAGGGALWPHSTAGRRVDKKGNGGRTLGKPATLFQQRAAAGGLRDSERGLFSVAHLLTTMATAPPAMGAAESFLFERVVDILARIKLRMYMSRMKECVHIARLTNTQNTPPLPLQSAAKTARNLKC